MSDIFILLGQYKKGLSVSRNRFVAGKSLVLNSYLETMKQEQIFGSYQYAFNDKCNILVLMDRETRLQITKQLGSLDMHIV